MILRDRLNLLADDGTGTYAPVGDPLPCHVGPPVSSTVPSSNGVLPSFTQVTAVAILEPGTPFDPGAHRIRWRGEDWDVDGVPAYVRRHGRDHHVSIPLKRWAP